MLGWLSSAARMPLPGAISARAVLLSALAFIWYLLGLHVARERLLASASQAARCRAHAMDQMSSPRALRCCGGFHLNEIVTGRAITRPTAPAGRASWQHCRAVIPR